MGDGVVDERGRLRVMTLNALAPGHADWPHRREVLRERIAAVDPDVLALQEVRAQDVADLAGPGRSVVAHRATSDDGVGAVLTSRWPLRPVREVDLHVDDRVGLPWSAAVLAEVEVPGPVGPVLLVHHKPTWELGRALERELQAVRCARAVEEELAGRGRAAPRHVVLLGDLDDPPESASVRFLTGRQSLHGTSVAYRDAWEVTWPDAPGHTFTPANPLVRAGEMPTELGRRIDYVLVRCGAHGPSLEVARCFRVLDAAVGGVWASDHFGVVADLRLPAHPPGSWAPAASQPGLRWI
ncbi:endonuclease/exonuclease/phosphatase family protein [Kineococcus glutinatus]|uniref:Endonuclease/exonuclease/phosphatase domain-containing protein n=1 Tax=Kineococcus glutinatus TaxID=1070872 RepID=A0ABP9HG87_9ACTN